MIILPAIDIYEGKCVRLQQGKFNQVTNYGDDPVEMAKYWESKGAEVLHVVDLDGAKTGEGNYKLIEKIVAAISIPIELGGGLRTEEAVKNIVEIGVDQAIIGTLAVENFELVEKWAKKYPGKIAISVDAIKGKAAIHGWQTATEIDVLDIARKMERANIKRLIYTDIEKDGMLTGPNYKEYEKLQQQTSLEIVASGGVTTKEDIEKLRKLDLYGAIVGKALYQGTITLEEIL